VTVTSMFRSSTAGHAEHYSVIRSLQQKIFLRATAAIAVRLSHAWISQKRYKLGSPNLHHQLPERL